MDVSPLSTPLPVSAVTLPLLTGLTVDDSIACCLRVTSESFVRDTDVTSSDAADRLTLESPDSPASVVDSSFEALFVASDGGPVCEVDFLDSLVSLPGAELLLEALFGLSVLLSLLDELSLTTVSDLELEAPVVCSFSEILDAPVCEGN